MDIEVRQRQKDMHSGDNALQAFKRSHAKSKALENKKGKRDFKDLGTWTDKRGDIHHTTVYKR